jgi:hypothetical protein
MPKPYAQTLAQIVATRKENINACEELKEVASEDSLNLGNL